jgi:LysM repeat protein
MKALFALMTLTLAAPSSWAAAAASSPVEAARPKIIAKPARTPVVRKKLAAPLPPPPPGTKTHTVVKGDHLWALAGYYYQNNFRWKVIFAANQEQIEDPHWIFPGQVFIIPDVPGPEIGELGARPVESAPDVDVTNVPQPEPVAQQAAPEPEVKSTLPLAQNDGRRDDLSTRMPPGLTGQFPSMIRVKPPKGWSEDGAVEDFNGREILVAQGDSFNGTLRQASKPGDKYTVYRHDAPQEMEDDQDALYLQTVGVVEVTKALGGNKYTFTVLRSGDSLHKGDWLKRGLP